MKILVVSQYFWPENFRINDLCEELVQRGHEVTVLTGKPNYPSGKLFPEFSENPESFSNYKGCNIVRVPVIMRGSSSLKLVMNYFSYPLMASTLGLRKLKNQEFDVVFICQLSPIFLALPGVIWGKRHKVPVVMWVLDLWPESLSSVGITKPKILFSMVGWFVSFIYKRCDLILGQSRSFIHGISEYTGGYDRIRYFPSWAESVFLNSKVVSKKYLDDRDGTFKVLFAGNIGDAQDFPSILKAAKIIKKSKQNISIYIVGDGRALDSVREQVKKMELEGVVTLLGRYPLEDMPGFYSQADALLVTLKESEAFSRTIPGKLQTYMVAGRPILTMLSGEGSRVVEEAGCGLVAASGDYELLASNMALMASYSKEVLMNMGVKARSYAKDEFDRDKLISKLENWFKEVGSSCQRKVG